MKKLRALLMCLVACMCLISYTGNVDAASKPKLNKTKLTIYVGDTYKLKLKNNSAKVTWSTSKKKVATVSSKGKVTAKKAGKATIKAKANKKTYSCKVTVKNRTLNATEVDLEVGDVYQLKLKSATVKNWRSSDNKVVKVGSSGKVVAVGEGTATVSCTYKKKTYKCVFNVEEVDVDEDYTDDDEEPEDVDIETHEHTYTSEVVTVATCRVKGVKKYTCTVCGYSFTKEQDYGSHNYVKSVTAATCLTDEVDVYTCSECNANYSETIKDSALGHNHVASVQAATCTEPEITTWTCSRCDDSYSAQTADANGHTMDTSGATLPDNEYLIAAATCTSPARYYFVCDACDYVGRTMNPVEVGEPLGHDYYWFTKEVPTYSEEGSSEHKCVRCHDVIDTKVLPKNAEVNHVVAWEQSESAYYRNFDDAWIRFSTDLEIGNSFYAYTYLDNIPYTSEVYPRLSVTDNKFELSLSVYDEESSSYLPIISSYDNSYELSFDHDFVEFDGYYYINIEVLNKCLEESNIDAYIHAIRYFEGQSNPYYYLY